MSQTDAQAERMRAILETVVDGIITINKMGGIETVNPATLKMFGYEDASELVGNNIKMLMPEHHEKQHDGYLQHYRETGEKNVINTGREVEGMRKDGSVFPIELSVSEMQVNGEQMFTGVLRDASLRKDSDNRIKAILNTVMEGIITINEQGMIETVNPAALDIFGYDLEEMQGNNVKMLMPDPYHSEHDGYLSHYKETQEKKIIGIGREVTGKRKDGSEFPLELAVSEMWVEDHRMFTGIVRDITERKEAEVAKEEFISTVSHELRTPLTSIRGSIGLLKGGVAGELPDKAKNLLDIAHNNTERLLMLINDILDLSKIESGKMDFNFDQLKLDGFLEKSIEANQGYATQHGTEFILENNATGAYLYGDDHRLMQVMSNLMSNAAKFASKGSRVLISAVRHQHKIRISVTDHGCGIPEKARSTIFEKFTQADSSDTRKVGGTGLGLNITRLIVEKHNGSIDFVSEVNVGTTFYFDVPELLNNEVEEDIVKPGSKLQEIEDGQFKVLICEDEPDIASLLRLILAKAGFSSDVAYSAKQAMDLLAQNTYAAMTLDIMLPDKEGTELYQDLRLSGATEKLPVVFISAKANQVQQQMGDQEDTQWMNKPIDDDKLVELLNNAIKGKSNEVKRILHVEDDKDIRHLVSVLLSVNYILETAPNLAAARELLAKQKFDLVLLDIGLPDGSGLDLFKEIQKIKNHRPEVVIFSADDIRLAQAEGVAASLVKSKTSNDELVSKIEQVIKS